MGVTGYVRVRQVRPCTPYWSLGSSGSSVCTLEVARFVLVRLVRLGAPWESLDSCGSSGCALSVARFVRVRLGYLCSICMSFGLVMFVWMRPGSPWVRSGSCG